MDYLKDVDCEEDVAVLRELFVEYAESLGFELCFQHFDDELEELPGAYAPPSGGALLAVDGGRAVGCVAMRRLDDATCEMKRLYVRPGHRGRGTGRVLVDAIVGRAKEAGYSRMRLDTVAQMMAAKALYRSVGFVETEAYCLNPLEGAEYFELALASDPPGGTGAGAGGTDMPTGDGAEGPDGHVREGDD